jgi:TolB-like protein/predicted Zn-dependent protease
MGQRMSGGALEPGGSQSPTDPPASVQVPNALIHVFISYASQDAAVADAIVEALERHGLKCWIAPRDVVPGESYAGAIVHAIDATKLIVLVLSENAVTSQHVLREVERASSKRHPVVAFRIDLAPMPVDLEYFLNTSQWLDASASGVDSALPKLVDAVRRTVASQPVAIPAPASDTATRVADHSAAPSVGTKASQPLRRPVVAMMITVIAVIVAYLVVDKFWLAKRVTTESPATTPETEDQRGSRAQRAPTAHAESAAFAPPAHSIAVLPFVNMSEDPKQDYFSDGLSEELLNSLSRITQLQVAARTSSFSFKGKQVNIADIAHSLNVGAILEGSVRKDGGRVRITAQLINTVTGFHLWSETYDRNLREILALQTEIATAVTKALQATLLGDSSSALIELGGTQNPAAFDAYLRGQRLIGKPQDQETRLAEVATYSEATRLDPGYAKAYVGKSIALLDFSGNATGAAIDEYLQKARAAAEKAVALAPELGEAHSALATVLEAEFDFARAAVEHERALALSPGNAFVLRFSAAFFSHVGRSDMGIANAQRSLALDPLNPRAYNSLAGALLDARRGREAIDAYNRALLLDPNSDSVATTRGYAYLSLGDFEAARTSCATPPIDWYSNTCLAVVYHKLHRQSDADAALAAIKAAQGDSDAYQYAEIHAQWGNIPEALQWLETAYRLRDPGLQTLKVDPLLDPLRNEPRFKDIEQKLKFPT